MADHAPAPCRNRHLSGLSPTEPSQLHPHSMRMRQVNGQGLPGVGKRIGQVFCLEQSFASMATGADTDGDLLRTGAVPLVEDDELVRECLSERLTNRTKESAP